MKNTILFLLGHPGTGKYTIAKELAKDGHFILLDNHMINQPLFHLLRADGKKPLPPEIWEYVGKMWDPVLEVIEKIVHKQESFIFTNVLFEDNPNDVTWFHIVKTLAEKRGNHFVPVHVHCHEEEHTKRFVNPKRAEKIKDMSLERLPEYRARKIINIENELHHLRLDVTTLQPHESAEKIKEHLEGIV